jgi:hypothetical protein
MNRASHCDAHGFLPAADASSVPAAEDSQYYSYRITASGNQPLVVFVVSLVAAPLSSDALMCGRAPLLGLPQRSQAISSLSVRTVHFKALATGYSQAIGGAFRKRDSLAATGGVETPRVITCDYDFCL